jgi:hypothetical protein
MLILTAAHAQTNEVERMLAPLGGTRFEGWAGLEVENGEATLRVPGEAEFEYPAGSKGWYEEGFRKENDGTKDWSGYYGVQLEVRAPADRTLMLEATLLTPSTDPAPNSGRNEFILESKATVKVAGDGNWKTVTLPWISFDYNKSQGAFLKFIKAFQLSASFTEENVGAGSIGMRDIRLTRAQSLALEAPVRGEARQAGETAAYDVTVGNCTDSPQVVELQFDKYGWEVMNASVEPTELRLGPGESAKCTVAVHIPEEGVPEGGHEAQRLIALTGAGSRPVAQLEFITARDVSHPHILHTVEGWDEIREKVKKYPWASESQERDYVAPAEAWKVPEASTPEERAHGPERHPYVFLNTDFEQVGKTAIAWQLTRNKAYAEKVAIFLRRLADDKTGYPSTFAGTSMGEPQEGGNFQNVAIAYDAILDANVLTEEDKRSIEKTFRLYMESVEPALTVGNIGNWSTAADTAALFCSLAMGDLSAAERYLYGPGGFTDYLTKGVMDDGWWWEGSTSYNFWVAGELTQMALACQPWGIDLLNHAFPANFSPRTIINPWGMNPQYGMSFEKWGPNFRNTRSIKQLWDAVPLVADYRGIAFGMNDGHEEQVGTSRLELGYYAFRDPAYAPLIRSGRKRDLIYGVPELPDKDDAKLYLKSGYAENLGYALLRSQTENRAPREQIQAVFKIGTQGGYHGHFDRVSLNTIMRYGRSFWNPEAIWWGYGSFMYKFYVQTSVAHNMVVVDQKMQEAVPSSQLLFHSGKMMQAVVDETNARWSDPPYGGMQYTSGEAFSDRMRMNKTSVPLVMDRRYGELGPYSDRVLQRRLGIVTDDYIVVADYLKGSQPHTFDDLFQMKGFLGLEADGKTHLRHDAQFNTDPHSSAQFVTDCDWYGVHAPATGRFAIQFGGGTGDAASRSMYNEAGPLKIDIHSLWPPRQEIMVGTPPENFDTAQWVGYEASVDGKILAKGESGIWILGGVNIDVPVKDARVLTLSINTDGSAKRNALFLANARWVTANGKEIPLADQPVGENIKAIPKWGEDYYGGPIEIEGVHYQTAIPMQPDDTKKPALLHIPLVEKEVVRFKATLGGDFPLGNESQVRKVYSIRSQGDEARFLTVLEPYENKPVIKSATATGPDSIRVELVDGRVQEIAIQNFSGSGKDIAVSISESRKGRKLREESAAATGE